MSKITWKRDREENEWVGAVDGEVIARAHTTSVSHGYWGHYRGFILGTTVRTGSLDEFKQRVETAYADWTARQATKDAHADQLIGALDGLTDLIRDLDAAREAARALSAFATKAGVKGYLEPDTAEVRQQLAVLTEAIENIKTAQGAVTGNVEQL